MTAKQESLTEESLGTQAHLLVLQDRLQAEILKENQPLRVELLRLLHILAELRWLVARILDTQNGLGL